MFLSLIGACWSCKEDMVSLDCSRASLARVPFLPRKKSLLVNNIFVVAAAILFGFSRKAGSFEMIMLGRLLIGVNAGTSSCLSVPIHSSVPFLSFLYSFYSLTIHLCPPVLQND